MFLSFIIPIYNRTGYSRYIFDNFESENYYL